MSTEYRVDESIYLKSLRVTLARPDNVADMALVDFSVYCHKFNEFGIDGGPATKSLCPKFNVFSKHLSVHTGLQVLDVEIKYLVADAIAMKGLGCLLFNFGSSLGAYLLAIATPILYDFYNYDVDKKQFAQLFVKLTQSLALLGALLFFIGMKNSMPRRVKEKATKAKTV